MPMSGEKKTSYRFAEAEKAISFIKILKDDFNISAGDIDVHSEKTVSLEVPSDKECNITKAANGLGGYMPTKPDSF